MQDLRTRCRVLVFLVFTLILLGGCEEEPWNNPYPYEDPKANVLYSAFSERPKHLDPARSYSEPEWSIIAQIYEPPLQYHYLKRPYVLEPLSAIFLPEIQYYGRNDEPLGEDASPLSIAYTDYIIKIKPGIYYQNHPAFAKNKQGQYLYHQLTEKEASQYRVLSDFLEHGTREVVAEDYVYQIKRLAEPHLSSPIYGLMSRYIQGLSQLRETLHLEKNRLPSELERDLRAYTLKGVEVLDRYTYRIRIQGKYPQFRYWLAMPFFAPIPWEVAKFYAQPGLQEHNISLDWYPVGTGPFILDENNPDRRLILLKNPNFREEYYPLEGMPEDKATGLLDDAGKRLPLIDKVIFTLEKEHIPYWNKFLQGYYDISGISSDNFGSVIHLNPSGGQELTENLKQQGVHLQMSVGPGIWYWGFNMLDETVGGYTERARKLRQAIALAFDVEEYVSLFLNGRGILASGPIPPDIFGFETESKPVSSNISRAKELLKEAEIPSELTIYFDTMITGAPDEIANHVWLKEQFEKIGLQLIIRGTDYNRFQEKMLQGNSQLYFWGWNADYPDPENFLFLLYGPNSSAKAGGENSSNYSNPEYDKLFEAMRELDNTTQRAELIQKMISLLENDNPWIWGFYPKIYTLHHHWVRIGKPSGVINNSLKYLGLDPVLRAKQQKLWNRPLIWPMVVMCIILVVVIAPVVIRYRWRANHAIRKFH